MSLCVLAALGAVCAGLSLQTPHRAPAGPGAALTPLSDCSPDTAAQLIEGDGSLVVVSDGAAGGSAAGPSAHGNGAAHPMAVPAGSAGAPPRMSAAHAMLSPVPIGAFVSPSSAPGSADGGMFSPSLGWHALMPSPYPGGNGAGDSSPRAGARAALFSPDDHKAMAAGGQRQLPFPSYSSAAPLSSSSLLSKVGIKPKVCVCVASCVCVTSCEGVHSTHLHRGLPHRAVGL
jgi:hypothetical protein